MNVFHNEAICCLKLIKTLNNSFATNDSVPASYQWFFIGYWIKRPGFLSGLLFFPSAK